MKQLQWPFHMQSSVVELLLDLRFLLPSPRHLSRCRPLPYRLPLLDYLCADEISGSSRPSASFPCTCKHCAGKVDVLVGTMRIHKLSCCQEVIALLARTAPVQLSFLLFTLLLDMNHDATDRCMRDTICGCYSAERFLLLHHTLHDSRPQFNWNTIVRIFRP